MKQKQYQAVDAEIEQLVANIAFALRMAYCQKLLMPVHSEWMESVYVPLPHGCAKGQEPGYTRKVKKKDRAGRDRIDADRGGTDGVRYGVRYDKVF